MVVACGVVRDGKGHVWNFVNTCVTRCSASRWTFGAVKSLLQPLSFPFSLPPHFSFPFALFPYTYLLHFLLPLFSLFFHFISSLLLSLPLSFLPISALSLSLPPSFPSLILPIIFHAVSLFSSFLPLPLRFSHSLPPGRSEWQCKYDDNEDLTQSQRLIHCKLQQ